MTDRQMTPEKLRQIADWFDTYDRLAEAYIGLTADKVSAEKAQELLAIVRGKGVQEDLRQWADDLAEPDDDIPKIRIGVTHRVADSEHKHPVSWSVYGSQWLTGGDSSYYFSFTRIDSDQWSRVSGELARYDEWQEGEPEDKNEYPVVLRVNCEPDVVEDGFLSIAYWLQDLMAWSVALAKA